MIPGLADLMARFRKKKPETGPARVREPPSVGQANMVGHARTLKRRGGKGGRPPQG